MRRQFCFLVVCFVGLCVGDSLRFLIVGDWGGKSDYPYTTDIQLKVAEGMGNIANQFGSQFTVGIGDNFYERGIPTDVNDPRFSYTYEQVYTAPSLQSRWYMVAGNHDHIGNVSAQIAYTRKSNRWYFPNEWYTTTQTIPGSNVTVQFVYFDTVIFPDSEDNLHMLDNVKLSEATKRLRILRSQEQLKWIQQTLATSKADWIFVLGHYPVYSIASHGPTPNLVQMLKPLLEQYKVAAYFCGHDHNLQHLHESGSPVDYYLTGAGHQISTSQEHAGDVPSGSSKFFWPDKDEKKGGFNTVEVIDRITMQVVFYDDKGKILYSHTKTNPRA